MAAAFPLSDEVGRSLFGGTVGSFGWNSALCIACLALSQLLRGWRRSWALAIGAVGAATALVALNGYLLGQTTFHGKMSLTTLSILLPLLLANGLRFARHPLVRGVLRDSLSGRLIRRQLALSVAIFLIEPLLLRPGMIAVRDSYPLVHTLEMMVLLGAGLYFAGRFLRLLDRERFIRAAMRQDMSRDPLTGAVTRRAAVDRFLRWDPGKPMGLILIDLDHFKSINDGLGHNVGDEVLTRAAQAMRDQLRVTDLLARWGGEEFMVLAQVRDEDQLADLAERLRLALHGIRIAELEDRVVTASLGTCLVDPATEPDLRACVAYADAAMYDAKAAGRDRVHHAQGLSVDHGFVSMARQQSAQTACNAPRSLL